MATPFSSLPLATFKEPKETLENYLQTGKEYDKTYGLP